MLNYVSKYNIPWGIFSMEFAIKLQKGNFWWKLWPVNPVLCGTIHCRDRELGAVERVMIFIFTASALPTFSSPKLSRLHTWKRAKIDILLHTRPRGSIRLWFSIPLSLRLQWKAS
jgi:hypothetical protein